MSFVRLGHLAIVLASLGASLVGCSDDAGGNAKERRCERMCREADSRCGANDYAKCTELFCNVMVPPAGCLDAVEAATCAELDDRTAPWVDTCFPPCSTPGASCQGDQIVRCTDAVDGNLRTLTSECTQVCAASDQYTLYSGVCADTYQGQPSSTGFDVCWCR